MIRKQKGQATPKLTAQSSPLGITGPIINKPTDCYKYCSRNRYIPEKN